MDFVTQCKVWIHINVPSVALPLAPASVLCPPRMSTFPPWPCLDAPPLQRTVPAVDAVVFPVDITTVEK
jgi:hypothetical protein